MGRQAMHAAVASHAKLPSTNRNITAETQRHGGEGRFATLALGARRKDAVILNFECSILNCGTAVFICGDKEVSEYWGVGVSALVVLFFYSVTPQRRHIFSSVAGQHANYGWLNSTTKAFLI
jgi:hypothetical protein